MHACSLQQSQSAIRQTMELNTKYHTPEEIVVIMSELTGEAVDTSLTLFPPFYTDFGRNVHQGEHVFINSCCNFQDQGGIYIGDPYTFMLTDNVTQRIREVYDYVWTDDQV